MCFTFGGTHKNLGVYMDFHRNKKYIAALAIIVIFSVGVMAYSGFNTTGQAIKKYGTIEEKIQAEIDAAKQKITRPDYLPAVVYKNLPPFPEDFYTIDLLIFLGRITDIIDLDEKYWKQPEFYPGFEDNINLIANPERGRFYGIGYGAYPGDIGAEAGPGDDFTVASFFHTSWLVETYQGMQMNVVYPSDTNVPSQNLEGNQASVKQDPEVVKNYFEVTATPDIFLLEPANPIFGSNWAQKVLVHVKIKEDTPKGIYVIGINPTTPPKEYGQKWTKQYLTKYVDASAGVIGRPFVRIIVDVK